MTTRCAIAEGHVTHVRRDRPERRFTHRACTYVIDIDAIEQLPRSMRWLLGVDRPRPVGFRTSRLLRSESGATLRERIDSCLARHGRPPADGPVLFVGQLSVLGYVFNPVAWWCCHDSSGELHTVIAEVSNTFGDRVTYALPAIDARRARSTGQRKEMHVSPFQPMERTYDLQAVPPSPDPPAGERISFTVTVRSVEDDEVRFVGTQQGTCQPLTVRRLLLAQLRHPFAPQVTTALIHLHAVVLWMRRARFFRRPVATGPHAGPERRPR